eukprot:COSAG02_NODE_50981_length_317_cov_0.706422_1_plen_105_part_11
MGPYPLPLLAAVTLAAAAACTLVLSSACSVQAVQGPTDTDERASTTGDSRDDDAHHSGTKRLEPDGAVCRVDTSPKRGARLRSMRPMGKLTRDAVANGPLAEVVA